MEKIFNIELPNCRVLVYEIRRTIKLTGKVNINEKNLLLNCLFIRKYKIMVRAKKAPRAKKRMLITKPNIIEVRINHFKYFLEVTPKIKKYNEKIINGNCIGSRSGVL